MARLHNSRKALGPMAQKLAKPGSEVKKLDYFVGAWTTKGRIAPGPWGAGGKFSWAETTKWMNGNFFLIGNWDFKMPPELGGHGQEIFLIGYDTEQNLYTFDAFSSQGRHQVSRGTVSGNTWTWTSESSSDDQKTKQKMTFKILSPTSYSLKFEVCMDGTTWVTFMEGQAKKK
jgi:hypothetical protein